MLNTVPTRVRTKRIASTSAYDSTQELTSERMQSAVVAVIVWLDLI
jgi:hypothetical protein